MRPASDTVSAFFACLLAERWEDAISLLDARAIGRWKEAFLQQHFGLLNLGADTKSPTAQQSPGILRQLASQAAPEGFGVATVEELFALPGPELLARFLPFCLPREEGRVCLPWRAEMEIRGEREVLAGETEVTYRYILPSDEESTSPGRRRTMTWTVRLFLVGGHWRMQIPEALIPPF